MWKQLSVRVKELLNTGMKGEKVTLLYELNVSHRARKGFCTGSAELIFTSAPRSHCDLRLLAEEKGKGTESKEER